MQDTEKRGRAGRPTREEQARRREELLETALEIFLERGFEQTTVEEIAARTAMSKRTVYARYADKSALFTAAVARAVERYSVPYETVAAVVSDDLAESLAAVARLRIANLSTPVGITLQRILITQSHRFPDLFRESIGDAAGPTLQVLTELFERHRDELVAAEPRRAATAFLSLSVSGSAREIVAGVEDVGEAEIEERIRFAVRLFLDGMRRR